MNGSDTVWDDGTSSAQTIVWDNYGKLSNTGLGSEGVNKTSFISDGETQTFDLSDFGLTSFDPTTFDTLGVRATSVNGTGAIKWVDETPETGQGPLVPGIAQITNTAVDEVLNDISGGGTFERVVYSAPGSNGDFDVLAFTYTPPSLGGGLHTLNGTFQVVNNGPGDQTNPHVSGDIAAYTSDDGVNSQIRYFDFVTSTDHSFLLRVPHSYRTSRTGASSIPNSRAVVHISAYLIRLTSPQPSFLAATNEAIPLSARTSLDSRTEACLEMAPARSSRTTLPRTLHPPHQ